MKKRKTNQLKLWAIGALAILLLAASSAWAQEYVDCDLEGSPYNFYADDIDGLNIDSDVTVNLYTSVSYVFVAEGGILNIYSGSIGWLVVCTDAIVTVYGTDFTVDWQCDGTIVSLDGVTEFTPLPPTSTYMGGSILFAIDKNGNPMELMELFCLSDTPIYLVDLKNSGDTIEIDIKPGSSKNSINLNSRGVVPVALLSEGDFEAGDIDPGSVEFAGAKPVRSSLCDVDCDGDMDMLFHFRTRNLVDLNEDSTEAELTFTSTGGEEIKVTDSVSIVPCKKNKKKSHYFSDKKSDKKHKLSKGKTTKHKRPGPNHRNR